MFTSTVLAEDVRYYDVEIIVIENLAENAKHAENWPLEVNLPKPEKLITLGEPFPAEWLPSEFDVAISYMLLPADKFQLISEAEKIEKSKTQRVLYHTAWRQPGLDKDLSLPVYFKRELAGNDLKNDTQTTNRTTTHPLGSEVPAEGLHSSVLEGVLRVTLARYLHFEADLTYRAKIPEVAVNSENPFSVLDTEKKREALIKQGVIHLNEERRRIRSNELHYLDHPVLGVLLRITPYIPPVVDAANLPGSAAKAIKP